MILVSIVGDFHSSILPIFYNFQDKISKHILLYDDAKRDVLNAKNLFKGMRDFVELHNLPIDLQEKVLDEDSFVSIKECAEHILRLSENPEEIYINITDGYATLTTLLDHHLLAHGVNFIAYDMYDNEYNIINKNELTKQSMHKNLTIKDHFLLKGYRTKISNMKEYALKHKQNILDIFEKHSEDFSKFTQLSDQKYTLVEQIPHTPIKEIFLKMGEAKTHIKNSLLTGGLFECYVYILLHKTAYDDIEVGLEIFRQYGASEIKNEFDILVMKNNHLHTIECKFRNNVKLDQLIYQYHGLSNMVDEDAKGVIIMKNKPNYTPQMQHQKYKGLTYKRGKLAGIEIFGDIHNNPNQFTMQISNLLGI